MASTTQRSGWLLALAWGLAMGLTTLGLFALIEGRPVRSSPTPTLAADRVEWLDDVPDAILAAAPTPAPTRIPARREGHSRYLAAGASWFALDLPPEGRTGQAFLEVDRPDLRAVDLVTRFPDGTIAVERIRAGQAPAERAIPARRPVLRVPADGSEYYLRLEAPFPGVVQWILWPDERTFYAAFRHHDSLIAFYLGIVAILWFLNVFVFATTRNRLYLDYAVFLFFHGISTIAYEAFYLGTGLQEIPAIHQILMASIPLSLFAVLRFAERFLELSLERPIARWLLRGLSYVFLVLLLQLLLLGLPRIWSLVITVQSAAVLVTGFCLLGVAAVRACSGRPPHIIFLLAFIPHVLAVSGFLFGRLGLTAPDPAFYSKLILGSIIEMILLGLALAVAFRDAVRRREEANAAALAASERARAVESGFRARLETQVAARTAELARADRQKSHLLSILAHDLRSPLNSIVQISEFSLRPAFRERGQDPYSVVRSILQTGRSLYTLLENLLGWARLNWEGRQPSLEPFSLREALDPALDLYREQLQHKQIELSGLDTWAQEIRADRTMVTTLLRNLLSNAVRHTPNGGQICFEATVGPSFLRLGLANSGNPIPLEVMHALLDESEEPETRSRGGTDADTLAAGLGLLLCREVVHAHGGRLAFHQRDGFGPLIEFDLPIPLPAS